MSEDKPKKPSKRTVFFRRALSTLVMWALVVWVFVSGAPLGFFALLAALTLFGLWEILRMAGTQVSSVAKGGTLVLAALYLCGVRFGEFSPGVMEVGLLAVLVLGSFALAMRKEPTGLITLSEVAIPVLAFVLVPLMFYGAIDRLVFDTEGASAVPGAWLVLWLIAVTKFSDMGAYITGSLVGKRKMIPHISPGKTWEGLAGGFGFSLLAGVGLYAVAGSKLSAFSGWAEVVMLSVVLCGVAVVGDLAESVLKRSLVVKDSGAALPGIGGVLDLIDSICFTAPILWLWLGLRGAL